MNGMKITFEVRLLGRNCVDLEDVVERCLVRGVKIRGCGIKASSIRICDIRCDFSKLT